MILKEIQGDNINVFSTSAMVATLNALAAEGKLSEEDALYFADTHICVLAEDGIFKRILTKLFGTLENSGARCLILKVVCFEDT